MKRFWAAVIILLIILCISICTLVDMQKVLTGSANTPPPSGSRRSRTERHRYSSSASS